MKTKKQKKISKEEIIKGFLPNQSYFLISLLISLIFFWISKDNGMFWDNVLFASKMGNQLYENGIFNWTMPDTFDPAQAPFLGFILAVFWKILGHKLWVSHIAMVFFKCGFIYQLLLFLDYCKLKKSEVFFGALLVLVDPSVSSTLILVSPEIIILFSFFLALNGILKNSTYKTLMGCLLLSIISYRSLMLFGGLMVFDFLNQLINTQKSLKEIITLKKTVVYLISLLPAIVFLSWRLLTKGWIYTHPDSPWGEYSHMVTISGFLKNCLFLIHRYIDFGRVFICLFITITLLLFRNKISISIQQKRLLTLSVTSVIFVLVAVLLSTNPFGHRYFLVSYIFITLVAYLFLIQFKHKRLLYSLLFFGLITGNLWIYPKRISQGWDSTLAHLPYHFLRIETINYLDHEKIPIKHVASFFPNVTKIDNIDLSGDLREFEKFTKDSEYVFYSNIFNLTDEEYDILENEFKEIKRFTNYKIYVSILKSVKKTD